MKLCEKRRATENNRRTESCFVVQFSFSSTGISDVLSMDFIYYGQFEVGVGLNEVRYLTW